MHVYLRGNSLQRLRLASGLILFAFAATHFLNHSLGLLSLQTMHQAQELRTAVTRSWLGTSVLLGALLTHISLGLYKLSKRETWRMPRWEALQIGLGLAIPFLLFPHIINTRIAHVVFGVNDIYLYELKRLWPDSAILQSLLLLLVWGHGCMGLHYWLRLSDNYKRAAPALLVVAVTLPLLALGGFLVAGRATADIMSDPQAFEALKARSHWPNDADGAKLAEWRTAARIGFAMVLAAIAAVPLWRHGRRFVRRGSMRITYAGGPTIELKPGGTLLEASRAAGIRHASVCGGRARCTTCRIRIEKGLETLPPPGGAEAVTLKSIEAPPNVRLACQVRPTTSLSVAIISPPAAQGPPQADFVEIKEIVGTHVRAILAGQLVDLASSDPVVISRWAQGKITYPLMIPDLASQGFALAGARLDYLLQRPAAALVYTRRERPITVFMLPTGLSDALAVRGQRNGYHVLAWAEGSLAYFAVSDLAPEELDTLQEILSTSEAA